MATVWRSIRMLQLAGLTVISVVADGASSNCKCFRLHRIVHHKKSGVTYKAPKCLSPGEICLFYTRRSPLVGDNLKCLLQFPSKQNSEINCIGNKLTHEHLNLISYSGMNSVCVCVCVCVAKVYISCAHALYIISYSGFIFQGVNFP